MFKSQKTVITLCNVRLISYIKALNFENLKQIYEPVKNGKYDYWYPVTWKIWLMTPSRYSVSDIIWGGTDKRNKFSHLQFI